MRRVFLSASFPSGERGEAVAPYRPPDIAAAASSVVEAVLRTGATLAFGGHPTISPIVLHIAGLLNAGRLVQIWQSEWFADTITDEVQRLVQEESADLRMVEQRENLPASLAVLRERMLRPPLDAAFLIGGMEGIEAEADLLRELHPHIPVFVFDTPGGMAATLSSDAGELAQRDWAPAQDAAPGSASRSRDLFRLSGRAYGSDALAALALVDLHVHDARGEL